MYPHFKKYPRGKLEERLSVIQRNKRILESKLQQIDFYAKGYYYPVSSLVLGKKNAYDSYSLDNFVDRELLDHWRPVSYDEQEDIEIRRFVGSFLFLALSTCVFFEQNPDAAKDLNYISIRNLAGVVILSEADGFIEYLSILEQSRRDSDDIISKPYSPSYNEIFRKASIKELEWYEYAVTESYYDSPSDNIYNDFFNLMYVICSVLQDKTVSPEYDVILLPESPEKAGPSSADLFFEQDFYEYDRETNPDLFKTIENETYLHSHKYLIETFYRYADRFPCDNDPFFKFRFLARYEDFRKLYLKYGYKGQLHKWVTDCMDNYLSFGTDLSFLGSKEAFEAFYEPLFSCTNAVRELYEAKHDQIL